MFPNILIGLAEKKIILLLPFPFFIWTALCLVSFFGMLLAIRMNKPLIDWKNSLYWPKRTPGAGNSRGGKAVLPPFHGKPDLFFGVEPLLIHRRLPEATVESELDLLKRYGIVNFREYHSWQNEKKTPVILA